jgi:zinc/manganese transport system permease protein
MIHAWEAGTIVAFVAGVVGFFAVVRGAAFAAHALPNGAFAGAAGASLIAVNALIGLGVFSLAGAVTIAALGRRARNDVATALTIVMMLGLGALFLSQTTEYAPEIYALLFGEILGVSSAELIPTAAIAAGCIAAILVLYRPLLLSSVLPEVARARGVSARRMELLFLLVLALTTTMASSSRWGLCGRRSRSHIWPTCRSASSSAPLARSPTPRDADGQRGARPPGTATGRPLPARLRPPGSRSKLTRR